MVTQFAAGSHAAAQPQVQAWGFSGWQCLQYIYSPGPAGMLCISSSMKTFVFALSSELQKEGL